MLEKRQCFHFKGNVQGVGFRVTTARFAQELGVKGYVQNLKDGSVELYAVGESSKVDELLMFLKETFSISELKEIKTDPTLHIDFDTFSIKYKD